MSELLSKSEYVNSIEGKILSSMKQLVNATIRDNREHIFKICYNDKINEMIQSDECAGEMCTIIEGHVSDIGLECPNNYNEVGTFHTHPGPSAYPSIGDILTTLIRGHKLLCIGAKGFEDEKVIRCFEYPFELDRNKVNEYIKTYKNVNNIYKEKTGRDFRKDISDKNVKWDCFKTEKDAKEFNNALDKSFNKRQILEKHYDDIYISDTFKLSGW